MNDYGNVTPSLIGFTMKEAVRRAMVSIRRERLVFESTSKRTTYNPEKPDFVTSADNAAQHIYLKTLRDGFPSYGIVAEEDELRIPCTHPAHDLWFTIDPLDGTKAFMRRQSHGIGTMLSLVCDGEVIAAYVGDVTTNEIYGYRPESSSVHRLTDMDAHETLSIDRKRELSDQIAFLRDPPDTLTPRAQKLVQRGARGLTRTYQVFGGSIGVFMARLWKGEVGMVILPSQTATPWDHCPVYGISRKLGFEFLLLSDDGTITEWENCVSKDPVRAEREIIIVHESDRPALELFLRH